MPSELRKIVFTKDEVRAAAVSYCLHAHVRMPQANIEDLVISSNLGELVTLKFTVSNPAERAEVILSQEQMAAAIIKFCREQGIPLPKKAKKLIRPDDTGLAMMINVEYEPARAK